MHIYRSLCSTFVFISTTFAQTYSECNPLSNTSCAADIGLSATSLITDFTTLSSTPSEWSVSSGSSLITYDSTNGATFTIAASGDSPTIQTSFYIFFGTVSVFLRAAPGTGIVSSVVLESDDLDEIDLEWIGGNTGSMQTNYFGKGNTTSYDRAIWSNVTDVQGTLHNYTIDWQSDATKWYIDSVLVRTLLYADALGGANYPQTPMRLKIGTWAGGDTTANSAGTVTWAGGDTVFSDGPFKMELAKVEITNTNPASSYTWSGQTGSFSSIKVVGANSSASAEVATAATIATTGAAATALAMNGTAAAASQSATATILTSSDAMGWYGRPSRLVASLALLVVAVCNFD